MTETKLVYQIGNHSIIFLQDENWAPNLSCAILLLFLVFILSLNSLVLFSVLCIPLRSNILNASIAILTVVSLIDGIFNVTSSVVFHASWSELLRQYGEDATRTWCRIDATLLQFTGMVQSFIFVIMLYDRQSLIPSENEDFEELTHRRNKIQILLKWMLVASVAIAFLLTIPIWRGLFITSLFEHRMSCGASHVTGKPITVFLAVLTCIIYLSSWLFIVRMSFEIVKKILNEHRRLIDLNLVARRRAAGRNSPFWKMTNSNDELWSCISRRDLGFPSYILTMLLTVSFAIAVVPNIIASQVTQFYSVYDENLNFYFPNRPLPPTELRPIRTDLFDSIFSWIRHGHHMLFPGLVVFMHREIRKQCLINFCCFQMPQPSYFQLIRNINIKWKKVKTFADHRTPVLFATSQGLHLRTLIDFNSIAEPCFKVDFCDLILEDLSCIINEPRRESIRKSNEIEKDREQTKLNETFVVAHGKLCGETYIKLPNGIDVSCNSRDGMNIVELDLISDNSSSLLSLSQRMRNRDS